MRLQCLKGIAVNATARLAQYLRAHPRSAPEPREHVRQARVTYLLSPYLIAGGRGASAGLGSPVQAADLSGTRRARSYAKFNSTPPSSRLHTTSLRSITSANYTHFSSASRARAAPWVNRGADTSSALAPTPTHSPWPTSTSYLGTCAHPLLLLLRQHYTAHFFPANAAALGHTEPSAGASIPSSPSLSASPPPRRALTARKRSWDVARRRRWMYSSGEWGSGGRV